MAKAKAAKTVKAKTVKAKIVVFYDDKGHYAAGGEWFHFHKKKPNVNRLLAERHNIGAEDLPHAVIIDVELLIPQPPKAKVTKVKQAKRA